jgi:hypothetical protein
VRRADGALVGTANVSQLVGEPLKSAYHGFKAFAPHAGQGYMTEGVDAVLRVAFRSLGLHHVEANVQPANVPSRALLTRLEFRCEGFSPAVPEGRRTVAGPRALSDPRGGVGGAAYAAGASRALSGGPRDLPSPRPPASRAGLVRRSRFASPSPVTSSRAHLFVTYGGHSSEPFA